MAMVLHPRHDHGGMDMDMDMGSSGYNNYVLQQQFWIFVGSVVAFAALVNALDYILLRQRLAAKSARPESIFWTSWATTTAIGRELYSASLPAIEFRGYKTQSFVVGPIVIALAYFVAVVVFWYIGTDPSDSYNWENIAVRIGCINQAQLPLLFLLAGKQNIIGWLTGLTYERINWLHRWTARILWVGVTMHLGFFFRSWAQWDYIKVKVAEDNMTQTGLAAWCILTVILLLSFAPVRRWNYELFLISHIVLFAGLVGTAMIHVMSGTEYIWACVGIFLFDRTARFVVSSFCNLGFLKGARQIWANRAVLTPLPGNLTRITIENPTVCWKAGQHMFLSCHGVLPLQSHPFTIASLPSDGKLEFLVQARSGGTKRLHRWASKTTLDLSREKKLIGLEGPYGHLRPLAQFDSVVFFAGSTGATFVVPLMREIIHRWRCNQSFVTRTIRFIWAIKSKEHLCWFSTQLEQAMMDVNSLRQQEIDVELDISIYITCDEKVASSPAPLSKHPQMETTEAASMMDQKKITNVFEVKVEEARSPDACILVMKQCCCQTTIEDEHANSDSTIESCCCNDQPTATIAIKSPSMSTSPSFSASESKPFLKTLSGRPHSRNIIRRVLEEAGGESAVVVCGPSSLQDDVRKSVVGLSDERAVHKGTGAQGIYLHVEGFGY